MKILYVEWIDSVVEGQWIEPKDMDEVHVCKTIGHLVKETKLSISLAATISGKEANAVQTIPKSWIRKKKTIKI